MSERRHFLPTTYFNCSNKFSNNQRLSANSKGKTLPSQINIQVIENIATASLPPHRPTPSSAIPCCARQPHRLIPRPTVLSTIPTDHPPSKQLISRLFAHRPHRLIPHLTSLSTALPAYPPFKQLIHHPTGLFIAPSAYPPPHRLIHRPSGLSNAPPPARSRQPNRSPLFRIVRFRRQNHQKHRGVAGNRDNTPPQRDRRYLSVAAELQGRRQKEGERAGAVERIALFVTRPKSQVFRQ